MSAKFDAVVVGAGPAGTIFSSEVAGAGFDVALIDQKPKEQVGKKVCGDGIAAGYFDLLDIKEPSGDELARRIDRSDVYTPDKKGVLQIPGEGYTINRLPFGQRLLKRAERKGVQFFPKRVAKHPILQDGVIKGVMAKESDGEELKLEARVTMDATGMTAALRSRVPEKHLLETKIDKFDLDVAHRYIAEFPEEQWSWRGRSISLYLNQNLIPGGYGWVFPKEEGRINVGVGFQPLGKGPSPQEVTDTFLEKILGIEREELEILASGASVVPVRRPLSMLVTDGLVLAGDVASNANPIHGGGIGHAMEAAHFAAKEIIPTLDQKEDILTKRDMWSYPKKYFTEVGGKNAALHILRLALQGFSNQNLNYIIKSGLISGEQLSVIQSNPEEGMGILQKITTGLRLSLFHRRLFRKLRRLQKYFERVYELYKAYPDTPRNIREWHKKVETVIEKAKNDLWSDPYQRRDIK